MNWGDKKRDKLFMGELNENFIFNHPLHTRSYKVGSFYRLRDLYPRPRAFPVFILEELVRYFYQEINWMNGSVSSRTCCL